MLVLKIYFLFVIYAVTINGTLLFTIMLWAASAVGINGDAADLHVMDPEPKFPLVPRSFFPIETMLCISLAL